MTATATRARTAPTVPAVVPPYGVGRETADGLKSLVCRTMPATGVASGFCSASPTVGDAARGVAATVPADVSLAMLDLAAWLAAAGHPTGRDFVKACREEAIRLRMRAASDAAA